MGLRKTVIRTLLYLSGSSVGKDIKQIRLYDNADADEIKRRSQKKLEQILIHAAAKVPYYSQVLQDCKVVVDGKVRLENFTKLPLLTKDTIRQQGRNLYSSDYKTRKPYENTFPGSPSRCCLLQTF